jgi:putative transposase
MYMNGSPEVRYRIINETISQDDNLLNISYLCEIAGVSRSGFYYWRGHQTERTASDEADQRDFDLIVAAYNFRGYSKGARGIHMRLRHQVIRTPKFGQSLIEIRECEIKIITQIAELEIKFSDR